LEEITVLSSNRIGLKPGETKVLAHQEYAKHAQYFYQRVARYPEGNRNIADVVRDLGVSGQSLQ